MSTIPPPSAPGPLSTPADPGPVKVTLLISAIFNILAGIGWATGCVTVVISIPLWVLAGFEIATFAKLNGPGPYRQHAGAAKALCILEICCVLVAGLPQLVCGIIGLVNLDKLERS